MYLKICAYTLVTILSIAITVLTGCSGGAGTLQNDQGAVTTKLVWPENSAIAKNASSVPPGVVTVRLSIAGPSMAAIQQDFPAVSGGGVLDRVPVGGGLTITASGLDAAGQITHTGTVGNVTVLEGQTTHVGTITMQSVFDPVSIAVTPANASITVGANQQFRATGISSDNMTKDLTSLVLWSSSSTSTATVALTGNAVAVAAGTTTITATMGTLSGSTSLSVNSAAGVALEGVFTTTNCTAQVLAPGRIQFYNPSSGALLTGLPASGTLVAGFISGESGQYFDVTVTNGVMTGSVPLGSGQAFEGATLTGVFTNTSANGTWTGLGCTGQFHVP